MVEHATRRFPGVGNATRRSAPFLGVRTLAPMRTAYAPWRARP